jgi:hypothetical protein
MNNGSEVISSIISHAGASTYNSLLITDSLSGNGTVNNAAL